MKPLLTRIAVIAVCAVIAVVMLPRSCSHSTDSRVGRIFTPRDSNYAPVNEKKYRPPSTPLEKQKPPVKTPGDVKQSDIREAIRIVGVSPDSTIDTTDVILSRDGHVYVQGGRRSLHVEKFEYLPPILAFGFFRQIGVSIAGLRPPFSISPCIGVSFLQVDGRFQLGTLLLDLDGIGIGAGYRIPFGKDPDSGPFTLGVLYHRPFEKAEHDSPSIRILITYNF